MGWLAACFCLFGYFAMARSAIVGYTFGGVGSVLWVGVGLSRGQFDFVWMQGCFAALSIFGLWTCRRRQLSLKAAPRTIKGANGTRAAMTSAGDLIVFAGRSVVDRLVQVATFSRYSHVGMVGEDGLMFESTSADLPPCQIMLRKIRGSQAQVLKERVKNYRGKVWRVSVRYADLTGSVGSDHRLRGFMQRRLTKFLVSQVGRPYDFVGAARSGGFLWNRIMRLLHPQSLDALFCSELCAATLSHMGYFHTANVSAWSPGKLVRELRRRGLVEEMVRLK